MAVDFSKLIEDEFTPEWAKNSIQALSPYPYLADILVIISSFAVGVLFGVFLIALTAANGD